MNLLLEIIKVPLLIIKRIFLAIKVLFHGEQKDNVQTPKEIERKDSEYEKALEEIEKKRATINSSDPYGPRYNEYRKRSTKRTSNKKRNK